jgi:hypothetical protein
VDVEPPIGYNATCQPHGADEWIKETQMISLEEFVRDACVRLELDFDNIREVELDDPDVPTRVNVWFNFDKEPLVLEIKYPQQG